MRRPILTTLLLATTTFVLAEDFPYQKPPKEVLDVLNAPLTPTISISPQRDYAIFLQMMLNKGVYNGARILAPRTVELMTSGQLDSTFNGMDNFGLGFEITSDPDTAYICNVVLKL